MKVIILSFLSKASNSPNGKIGTIKQPYVEKRHHNYSNNALLVQKKGRQDPEVCSQI